MDNNYVAQAKALLYDEYHFEELTDSQIGVIANSIKRDGVDEVRKLIELSIRISYRISNS